MVAQSLLLLCGHQVCDGGEIILLEEVKQDFSIVEVAHMLRPLCVGDAGTGDRQEDPEQQDLQRAFHSYHSLTSNSGW